MVCLLIQAMPTLANCIGPELFRIVFCRGLESVLESKLIMSSQGFTHRDLKPQLFSSQVFLARSPLARLTALSSTGHTAIFHEQETDKFDQNIFIYSISPLWIKLGDTLIHTHAFSENYSAPEICG